MTNKKILILLIMAIFIFLPLAVNAQQTPQAEKSAPHIVDAQGQVVPVKSIKKKGWWGRLWSDDDEIEVELKDEDDGENIAEVKSQDPEQQKISNEVKSQSRAQGMALGSAQGAAIGAAGGPVGAAAGSVVGGVTGAVMGEETADVVTPD